MLNLVPSLSEGLRRGKGPSSPLVSVPASRSSNASTSQSAEPAYKKVTLPSGEKIPRMHSYWIPAYLKIMERRRLSQIDDGYRLYEKLPAQRVMYKGIWTLTLCAVAYTAQKVFFFMRENRP